MKPKFFFSTQTTCIFRRLLSQKLFMKPVKNKLFHPYERNPPRLSLTTIAVAWVGSVLAVTACVLSGLSQQIPLILASFGASCLLVFAYPRSPFAQPRNIIGGHFISSLTGLVFFHLFGDVWWSLAVGEATAIALMLLLRVPHPPAASNPLIAMLGAQNWTFLWFPTFFGSLVLVAVALFYNNLGSRRYPTYWW